MLMRVVFLLFSALSAVAPDAADTIEARLVGPGNHYIWVDAEGRVSLWEETNGIPGLQTASFDGREGAPGYSADTRILA